MVAVIDCGGTARCGTYPRIGIPTINVKVMSPSGPLSKFMTEDIFISGVSINDIELLNEDSSEKEESIVDENENEEKDIHTKIKEAKEEQNYE